MLQSKSVRATDHKRLHFFPSIYLIWTLRIISRARDKCNKTLAREGFPKCHWLKSQWHFWFCRLCRIYLRPVEKYDTKEDVQNLMFLLFSGERRANCRFITLRRVTNFYLRKVALPCGFFSLIRRISGKWTSVNFGWLIKTSWIRQRKRYRANTAVTEAFLELVPDEKKRSRFFCWWSAWAG